MECLKCRRPSLNIQFMPYNSCKAKGNEVIELQHKNKKHTIYLYNTTNLLHLFIATTTLILNIYMCSTY